MATELERKANLLVYALEDGFSYTGMNRSEFIPITGDQYHRAKKFVEERGFRLGEVVEPALSDLSYLLQGKVIVFSMPNSLQLSHGVKLIDILSEPGDYLTLLIERIGLPLPR